MRKWLEFFFKASMKALIEALTIVLAFSFFGAVLLSILAILWLGELIIAGPEYVERYEIVEPTAGWVLAALVAIVLPYFFFRAMNRLDDYVRQQPSFELLLLDVKYYDEEHNDREGTSSVATSYPSYPDNWQELRQIVLERDGYRCVNCGDGIHDATLQVHHIVPLIKGGSNNLGNLATLCKPCHKKLHPHMR